MTTIAVAGETKVVVYPNPAKEIVNFAWKAIQPSRVKVTIFGISGDKIKMIVVSRPGQRVSWDAQDVAPGLYLGQVILTIEGVDKRMDTTKIAIQ